MVDVPPTSVIIHTNRRTYDNRFENLYVLDDPDEIPEKGNSRLYSGVNKIGRVYTVAGGDGTKYISPREAAAQVDQITRASHLAGPMRAYNFPNTAETCAQCEVDLPALWTAAPNYPIFVGDYTALCLHKCKEEQKGLRRNVPKVVPATDIDTTFIKQYLAMTDADRASVREYAQRQINTPAPPYQAPSDNAA
jgi:hypothetical protein